MAEENPNSSAFGIYFDLCEGENVYFAYLGDLKIVGDFFGEVGYSYVLRVFL